MSNKLYNASDFLDNPRIITMDEIYPKTNVKPVVINNMEKENFTNPNPRNNMNLNDFRPKNFNQVIGQELAKELMITKINAFSKNKNSLVHTLFLGYSGLGKTTLANVVANEMGVRFHAVMANQIKTWADFYNILKNIEENDILFIDEIHALPSKLQEHLYGVMEDFKCTVEDKNLSAKVSRQLPRFTIIGATTHTGLLNVPLISRFQCKVQLLPYTVEELTTMILTASERTYNVALPYAIAHRLAKLSRKTARIAYNLLRSLIDIAESRTPGKLRSEVFTDTMVNEMLKMEQIDPLVGLDAASRFYLYNLIKESPRPLGLPSLKTLCREQESTIINMIEPFLLSEIEMVEFDPKSGKEVMQKSPFVRITSDGRVPLQSAFLYLKTCQKLQKNGWFKNENLNVKSE